MKPPVFLHVFKGEETVGQGAMRHFGELQQLHLSALFDADLGMCDCGLIAEQPVLYSMGQRVFVVVHKATIELRRMAELFEELSDGAVIPDEYLTADIPTGDVDSDERPDDAS
jgi:hypothetical protein